MKIGQFIFSTLIATFVLTLLWEYSIWPLGLYAADYGEGGNWLVSYFMNTFEMYLGYLMLSTVFAIILGIPALALYRHQNWNSASSYLIGGLVIGVLVYLLLIGPIDSIINFTEKIDIKKMYKELVPMLCISSASATLFYWVFAIRKPNKPLKSDVASGAVSFKRYASRVKGKKCLIMSYLE